VLHDCAPRARPAMHSNPSAGTAKPVETIVGYTTVYPRGILISMLPKDVGLRIRLQRELRKAFLEACRAEERSASDVLREFMRMYAERSQAGKQGNLFSSKVKQ